MAIFRSFKETKDYKAERMRDLDIHRQNVKLRKHKKYLSYFLTTSVVINLIQLILYINK